MCESKAGEGGGKLGTEDGEVERGEALLHDGFEVIVVIGESEGRGGEVARR